MGKIVLINYGLMPKNSKKKEKCIGHSRRACTEILNFLYVRGYFSKHSHMHVKFHIRGNLTAAGSICKSFPCDIQNLSAANNFYSSQIFPYSM